MVAVSAILGKHFGIPSCKLFCQSCAHDSVGVDWIDQCLSFGVEYVPIYVFDHVYSFLIAQRWAINLGRCRGGGYAACPNASGKVGGQVGGFCIELVGLPGTVAEDAHLATEEGRGSAASACITVFESQIFNGPIVGEGYVSIL